MQSPGRRSRISCEICEIRSLNSLSLGKATNLLVRRKLAELVVLPLKYMVGGNSTPEDGRTSKESRDGNGETSLCNSPLSSSRQPKASLRLGTISRAPLAQLLLTRRSKTLNTSRYGRSAGRKMEDRCL